MGASHIHYLAEMPTYLVPYVRCGTDLVQVWGSLAKENLVIIFA